MARRFVTYNTEDQAAGLVNVDERGVMLPGGGGTGLPTDPGAYKSLVTDGSGNWVTEDRLAYEGGKQYVELLSQRSLTNEDYWEVNNIHGSLVELEEPEQAVKLNAGNKYRVVFNENEYVLTATQRRIVGSDEIYTIILLGNERLSREHLEDTGEPFVVETTPYSDNMTIYWSSDLGNTITIQISEERDATKRLDPKLSSSEPFVVKINSWWDERTGWDIYEADRSFESIAEAYYNGRPIHVCFGDEESKDFAYLYRFHPNHTACFFGKHLDEFVEVYISYSGEVAVTPIHTLPNVSEYDAGALMQVNESGQWVAAPLDPEFIPSTTPNIQSATVGQTVVVKAVDETGKPTEWEAVAMGGYTMLSAQPTREEFIQYAKELAKICWVKDGVKYQAGKPNSLIGSTGKFFLKTVYCDSYMIETDTCDTTTYNLKLSNAYELSDYNVISTITLTEEEAVEIYNAWRVLAGYDD